MVVLGVEESLSKKKWIYRPADEDLIVRVAQQYDLPEVMARILVSRQIENLDRFLSPTLRNDLPNPETLRDVTKTAERIADSVERV